MKKRPPSPPRWLPDRKRTLEILGEILAEPTAPFHEHRARRSIAAVLERAGIPCRVDAYGNLLARYRRGHARPLAMTAHMDHPGFELLSVAGTSARARWNGQVPTFNLKGLRLALWPARPDASRRGAAEVLDGDGRRPPPLSRELRLRVPLGAVPGDFGHLDLTPLRLGSSVIESRALDDLAGCAAIASSLDHLARHKLPGDVRALFTRAEEVGFHGALGAIGSRWIPRSVPVLVLECSKAMPGAEQGEGPVIRVGDRASVFDPDLAAACEETARALRQEAPQMRFQRRLMDGGTCEASAFSLAGYRSVCLAFPLANYHNVGLRSTEPERISQRDFQDGVACLAGFASQGLDPKGARRRLAAWVQGRFGAPEARRLQKSA